MPRTKPKPPESVAALPQYLTLDDVAALLSMSRSGVRRLLFGTAKYPVALPHARFGTSIRIPEAALLDYLAAETRFGAD